MFLGAEAVGVAEGEPVEGREREETTSERRRCQQGEGCREEVTAEDEGVERGRRQVRADEDVVIDS